MEHDKNTDLALSARTADNLFNRLLGEPRQITFWVWFNGPRNADEPLRCFLWKHSGKHWTRIDELFLWTNKKYRRNEKGKSFVCFVNAKMTFLAGALQRMILLCFLISARAARINFFGLTSQCIGFREDFDYAVSASAACGNCWFRYLTAQYRQAFFLLSHRV